MPGKYDDLRPYATPRQLEYLDAIEREGSVAAACDSLGINQRVVFRAIKNIKNRAALGGFSPAHALTHSVPDGYVLKGASTLYDQDGVPKQQWVKSAIDPKRQEELLQEAIEALCEGVKPAKPVKAGARTRAMFSFLEPICIMSPVLNRLFIFFFISIIMYPL